MLLAPEDGARRAAFLSAATTSASRPGCCLPSLPLRARHCATARGDPLSAAWPGPCPSAAKVLGLNGNHNMLWYHCLRALVLVSAHHRETFPGLQQAVMRQRTRQGVRVRSVTQGSARYEAGRQMEPAPIEERTRVSLAVGRDIAVPHDRFERIGSRERGQQRVDRDILSIGEGLEIRTFELDADREVVAARPPPEHRGSGMPGAIEARDELD